MLSQLFCSYENTYIFSLKSLSYFSKKLCINDKIQVINWNIVTQRCSNDSFSSDSALSDTALRFDPRRRSAWHCAKLNSALPWTALRFFSYSNSFTQNVILNCKYLVSNYVLAYFQSWGESKSPRIFHFLCTAVHVRLSCSALFSRLCSFSLSICWHPQGRPGCP